MKHLFSRRALMFRWPLAAVLLCFASALPLYSKEPPIDEKAARAMLEAKDLKSLDLLSAKVDPEDEALRAIYRSRRLALNNTREEELRYLKELPDSGAKLSRVYQLTHPSPSGLGEDPRIEDVVYGMFERAARLAQKHGSGHRRVLRICLASDGELAETAWEWCNWLVKADPERALSAIRSLPVQQMQTWSPTWRGSPFVAGHVYRVIAIPAFGFVQSKPTVGDVLIYRQSGYSRYDNCSVYEFVSRSGQTIEWWLADEQPLADPRLAAVK